MNQGQARSKVKEDNSTMYDFLLRIYERGREDIEMKHIDKVELSKLTDWS